jgi:adenylate kinase
LIKHYGDQNRLVVVNGIGHPDDVFVRLVKAVEANRA